jgi:hypothetical protein
MELSIEELRVDIELIKLAISLEDDCDIRRCLKNELETAEENLQNIK